MNLELGRNLLPHLRHLGSFYAGMVGKTTSVIVLLELNFMADGVNENGQGLFLYERSGALRCRCILGERGGGKTSGKSG